MNAHLLRTLRDHTDEYAAVPTLGESPEQTGRDLDELEAFGFLIERHPLRGVALRGPAARLCPDQIEHDLGTRCVGRRVAVWNTVASTNDLAALAAGSSANDGLVVLAEEQTAGRGRRGRSWSAPAGSSLLMSVLLFPASEPSDPAWLTALAAVAVAEVVSQWSPRPARIKWPNDVRVDGRKIAGVLVERAVGAVIGVGVNLNLALEDLPPELRETATSLQVLIGGRVDRSEFARELIRGLDARYDEWRTRGPSALNARWRSLSEHLGRPVQVETASGPVVGRLDDLDLTAGLTLSRLDGAPLRFGNRDVLAVIPCD